MESVEGVEGVLNGNGLAGLAAGGRRAWRAGNGWKWYWIIFLFLPYLSLSLSSFLVLLLVLVLVLSDFLSGCLWYFGRV
jgi:hypothetical protein